MKFELTNDFENFKVWNDLWTFKFFTVIKNLNKLNLMLVIQFLKSSKNLAKKKSVGTKSERDKISLPRIYKEKCLVIHAGSFTLSLPRVKFM